MKTILIDDDLYSYLVSQTQEIGESASSIIRRLIGLKEGGYGGQVSRRELEQVFGFLGEWERYRHLTNARKFLHILSWVYSKHGPDFERVLLVEGSRRKYFARTEQTLARSGKNTNPRPIPDSPFWVITNNSTMKKAEILSEVFRLLGYEPELIQAMLQQCLI